MPLTVLAMAFRWMHLMSRVIWRRLMEQVVCRESGSGTGGGVVVRTFRRRSPSCGASPASVFSQLGLSRQRPGEALVER